MTIAEFFARKGDYSDRNIFLALGDEGYLLDDFRRRFLEAFPVPFPELNTSIFRDTPQGSELETAILQAPAFSDKRTVVLDRIDIEDKKLKFLELMERIPAETQLLILSEKLKSGKVLSFLKENAVIIEASSPKEEQLEAWLVKLSTDYGINLRRNLARLMIEIAGGDMYVLKNEMDKLRVLGIKSPTEKDIHETVSGTLEYDIFSFHNSMMRKKYEEAFSIFEKMKKDREQVMGFLGLMVSKFYPMYLARSCIDSGLSNEKTADLISSRTKIKRYPALLAAQDARSFSRKSLRESLKELERIDHMLKTGGRLREYKTAFLKIYGAI